MVIQNLAKVGFFFEFTKFFAVFFMTVFGLKFLFCFLKNSTKELEVDEQGTVL